MTLLLTLRFWWPLRIVYKACSIYQNSTCSIEWNACTVLDCSQTCKVAAQNSVVEPNCVPWNVNCYSKSKLVFDQFAVVRRKFFRNFSSQIKASWYVDNQLSVVPLFGCACVSKHNSTKFNLNFRIRITAPTRHPVNRHLFTIVLTEWLRVLRSHVW